MSIKDHSGLPIETRLEMLVGHLADVLAEIEPLVSQL
jgi:hypothetical protein